MMPLKQQFFNRPGEAPFDEQAFDHVWFQAEDLCVLGQLTEFFKQLHDQPFQIRNQIRDAVLAQVLETTAE